MHDIFLILSIALNALLSGAMASADVTIQSSPPLYSCDILIVSAEHASEKMITVPSKMDFNQSANHVRLNQDPHDVSVALDGQWIVINWAKSGKNLAAGAFILGTPSKSPRIAILYNPMDFNEQVSISCAPKNMASKSKTLLNLSSDAGQAKN